MIARIEILGTIAVTGAGTVRVPADNKLGTVESQGCRVVQEPSANLTQQPKEGGKGWPFLKLDNETLFQQAKATILDARRTRGWAHRYPAPILHTCMV